jgi:hypothetical protein
MSVSTCLASASTLLLSALSWAPESFELPSFLRVSIERSIESSRFSAALIYSSVLSAMVSFREVGKSGSTLSSRLVRA